MKPTQRKALGRGLGALLPGGGPDKDAHFIDCPLDQIELAPEQPRKRFDEERLKELAESIKTQGVLQPIVVNRDGEGYRLIAGERRLRASRLAGLRSVPAVVKDLSPDAIFEVALIENIQREDLDPVEEALAYERLLESHGYTQEQLAKRVGKDRSTVANSLRLLQLGEKARAALAEGQLSAGHARALLSVPEEARDALLEEIVREGLSVRATEARAKALRAASGAGRKERRARPMSPLHEIVAREMGSALGSSVELKPRNRRSGRIVISYDSLEALARIHRAITGKDGSIV